MRKLFIKICIILSIFIFPISLASCNNDSNDGTNKTDSNVKDIYLDSDPIETDSFSLTLKSNYCTNYSPDYRLSVYFELKNKEYSTKTFSIKNTSLTKVSTNATYNVSYDKSFSVDAELTKSVSFTSIIPSQISVDEYKLYFELESLKITLYLYETPDSLRLDRTISYYINNQKVHTDTIKDKRKLDNTITYETPDNQYYCDTWYTDSTYKTKFSLNTSIANDISLYGITNSNIKWSTTTSDLYSFVSGFNHIPSNGILVIPSTYLNKELCINLYAIKDITVSKIYIPKTVHTIYSGNFTGIGKATVYYEGTEAEWESIFYSQSSIYKTNVIYNTKYSN